MLEVENMLEKIRTYIERWWTHVITMTQDRLHKRTITYTPQAKKVVGRPTKLEQTPEVDKRRKKFTKI